MSDPFVAEIRMFPFNFPPKGWAFCDGQLLPISQNTALFALIGTIYGGDGRVTFALPDFRGRTALGTNNLFPIGTQVGGLSVTLAEGQMPEHVHSLADAAVPEPAAWALMITGFGLAGAAIRRRRAVAA